MPQFFYALRHWLLKHDLLDGVRIVIEFPNAGAKHAADHLLWHELQPLTQMEPIQARRQMLGMDFEFTYPCRCGGRHA